MSLTAGHFDVGIFLPAMFPINVQGKPFVLDIQWYVLFYKRIAFDSIETEADRQKTIK